LTSLDGLNSVVSVRGITLLGNGALTNVDGLSGITAVDGDIIIDDNGALANLDGLSRITSVGGDLAIGYAGEMYAGPIGNSALTNLDGLNGLTTIDGDLGIAENTSLPTCEATNLLCQLIAFDGSVYISDNLADSCTDDPTGCP
jgi:hypothetical protein